jgi:hypothetical protein
MSTPVAAVLALVVAWVLAVVFWHRLLSRKLSRVAASRDPSRALASFLEALPGLPEETSLQVYRLVQGLLPIPNFPIEPNDNLWSLYDLGQGTLESTVEDFIEGKKWPPFAAKGSGIETVVQLTQQVHLHGKAVH